MFRFYSSKSASVVYANNLAPLVAGHALWYPEPQETGEVLLCDIGYIHDGAFIRLLNVLTDSPPVAFWSPPSERFSSLPHSDIRCIERKAFTPGSYKSDGLVEEDAQVSISAAGPSAGGGLNIGYSCGTEQGALLILKSWGHKKEIIVTQHILNYILDNHESWYKYARNQLGLRVNREDIAFVWGNVKTTAGWLVAAFSNSNLSLNAGANMSAGGLANANVSMSRRQAHKGSPIARWGDGYDTSHTEPPQHAQSSSNGSPANDQAENHCIVVQRLIAKKRAWIGPRKLEAAAGPHQLPDEPDEDSDMAVVVDGMDVDEEDVNAQLDPVQILLDYILEMSDESVDTAIASEADVISLFPGTSWSTDFADYLHSTKPAIEVVGRGHAAMLSLPETIARQREHTITMGIAHSVDNDRLSDGDAQAATLAEGKILLGPSATRTGSLRWPHAAFKNKNEENGVVSSVTLSPDGTLLAISWDDCTISIWRVEDGAHILELEDNGHTDSVWTTTFSPDGQYLVSGSSDATVIVWRVMTGEIVKKLEEHRTDVTVVAYAPDGSRLATGSSDGCIKIWDTSVMWYRRHTLQEHDAEIRQLLFSSDSAYLVSCTVSGALVWDPIAGVRIASLDGHSGAIWSVAFSPQGDRLVTGSEDHTARVWTVSDGAELVTLREHHGSVWAVAFSPDGNEVATASSDGTVVSCDSYTGERRHVFSGSQSHVVEAVAYSKENDFIASGSADGGVRVWNWKSGDFVAEFQGHEEKVKGVAFTPDGWDLVSYAEDGTVREWSTLDAIRL